MTSSRPLLGTTIAITLPLLGMVLPAQAASTSEMITACITSMDEQGLAKASHYRTKLKRASGASVKKLVIRLIATEDGVDNKMIVCKIRRDKVIDVALQS